MKSWCSLGVANSLQIVTNQANILKKIIRTAAPAAAGGVIALTALAGAAPANAAPIEPATPSAAGKAASPQVASCFANRNGVPWYSYLAWANYHEISYGGTINQGQGLWWYRVTTVNGYTYVVGDLYGGRTDVMIPAMYMNC
jgi:hypothetical protein